MAVVSQLSVVSRVRICSATVPSMACNRIGNLLESASYGLNKASSSLSAKGFSVGSVSPVGEVVPFVEAA